MWRRLRVAVSRGEFELNAKWLSTLTARLWSAPSWMTTAAAH